MCSFPSSSYCFQWWAGDDKPHFVSESLFLRRSEEGWRSRVCGSCCFSELWDLGFGILLWCILIFDSSFLSSGQPFYWFLSAFSVCFLGLYFLSREFQMLFLVSALWFFCCPLFGLVANIGFYLFQMWGLHLFGAVRQPIERGNKGFRGLITGRVFLWRLMGSTSSIVYIMLVWPGMNELSMGYAYSLVLVSINVEGFCFGLWQECHPWFSYEDPNGLICVTI